MIRGLGALLFFVAAAATAVLASCGQDYNSNSSDAGAGDIGIDCTTAAGGRLCNAYEAFQSNHCFECHDWSSYKTDAAWEQSGLITAGQPDASNLVRMLQNDGGSMPQNYGPLTTDQYNAVRLWIQDL